MFPKLFQVISSSVVALALILMDYVWKDGQGKPHKFLRWFVKGAILVSIPIGIWGVVADDKASSELVKKVDSTQSDITSGFDANKKLLEATQEQLAGAQKELTATRTELSETRKELAEARQILNKIAEEIGISPSAKLSDQQVLREVQELKRRAQLLERGVSDTFDFNGCRRITARPGHVSTKCGAEYAAFQLMEALQQERDWKALEQEAQARVASAPKWWTAHLYLGVAQANLGKTESARQALQRVIDATEGDAEYADAARILHQLDGSK